MMTARLRERLVVMTSRDLPDHLLNAAANMFSVIQSQTAVTAYLKSKQLLLFVLISQHG